MKTKNTFAIIVALGQANEIGKDGDLLWHLHDDMVFFRNTTRGHPVVMGRKTWDSLQVRPLPKRDNIVVTNNKDFAFEGVKVLHSIEEIKNLPLYEQDIFIIGGGTIYKEFLPIADKLYITKVYKNFPDADTFFPTIDESQWVETEKSEMHTDEQSGLQFQFITLVRK